MSNLWIFCLRSLISKLLLKRPIQQTYGIFIQANVKSTKRLEELTVVLYEDCHKNSFKSCLLRLIGICSTNIGPGYCSGQGLKISEPYIEQHAQSNDEN